jgi:hypothetical protein
MKHLAPGAFALANPLAPTPRAVHAAPRADATDPKAMLSELKAAFEDFKKANDEKLKAKTDDVVVTEKVDRINSPSVICRRTSRRRSTISTPSWLQQSSAPMSSAIFRAIRNIRRTSRPSCARVKMPAFRQQ